LLPASTPPEYLICLRLTRQRTRCGEFALPKPSFIKMRTIEYDSSMLEGQLAVYHSVFAPDHRSPTTAQMARTRIGSIKMRASRRIASIRG